MRFSAENVLDALAPTNFPALNPAALKATLDTGGRNLVQGSANLVHDLRKPPHIPAMVDTKAFTVGKDLAVTPGAVVLRTELFELIQYEPSTAKVRETPLLLVPPMINKFYIADVAPGRSMLEYFVGAGQQCFTISWRNPDERHAEWGLDDYVSAVLEALEAVETITGSPKSHVMGLCAGGITASCAVGHLAATDAARPDRRADARRVRARQRERRHGRRARRQPDGGRVGRRVPAQGLPRRPRARGRVRLAAAQRPGLELLGQQLPARQGPAGLRRPLLERRLDEPAGRAAPRLHGALARQRPRAAGRARRARHADRPLADHRRLVPGGRDRRPHHAVAEQLPLDAAARLRAALRALHQRAHRVARQPAGQREGQLPGQRLQPARGRDVAARGDPAQGHVVGRLRGVAGRALRARRSRRASGSAARASSRSTPRRAPTCSTEHGALPRAPRRGRAAAADHRLDDQRGGVRAGARRATPSTSSASPTTTAARRGRAGRRRRRWARSPTTPRGC